MRISHQISLPVDVWNDFVYHLNHCNQSRRQKINAFFTDIEQNLTIRREATQILVESSNLDEAAILAALLADDNQHIEQRHLIEAFDTINGGLFDFGKNITAIHQAASEDSYNHLLTAKKTRNTGYSTENADPNKAAAA